MVLAKLLFMMLGKCSISFHSFEWIAVLLNGTQSGHFQKPEFVPQNLWRYLSIAGWFKHFLSMGTVCLFRQIHKDSNSREDLLTSLFATHGHQATDPRDKIYALLGIGKTRLILDYSSLVEEVYCQYATDHVEHRKL